MIRIKRRLVINRPGDEIVRHVGEIERHTERTNIQSVLDR
jgi:hypothetical protein